MSIRNPELVCGMQANIAFRNLIWLQHETLKPTANLFCQEAIDQNDKLQIKFTDFSFKTGPSRVLC